MVNNVGRTVCHTVPRRIRLTNPLRSGVSECVTCAGFCYFLGSLSGSFRSRPRSPPPDAVKRRVCADDPLSGTVVFSEAGVLCGQKAGLFDQRHTGCRLVEHLRVRDRRCPELIGRVRAIENLLIPVSRQIYAIRRDRGLCLRLGHRHRRVRHYALQGNRKITNGRTVRVQRGVCRITSIPFGEASLRARRGASPDPQAAAKDNAISSCRSCRNASVRPDLSWRLFANLLPGQSRRDLKSSP